VSYLTQMMEKAVPTSPLEIRGRWGSMDDPGNPERCDFCKIGHVVRRNQPISFHQWTDKGYVFCNATIPVGICDRCRAEHWDEVAEAMIEDAVRKEYDKLP
jgi:hypothetical protein